VAVRRGCSAAAAFQLSLLFPLQRELTPNGRFYATVTWPAVSSALSV